MNKEAKGMDYPGFIDYIQEHVREFICCNEDWDDIVDIRIVPVIRNNETVVNTMWILEDGRLRCPQINLDDFFRDYCMSLDMDGVMEGILDIYRRSRSDDSLLDPEDMEDFFKIRDRIVAAVVITSPMESVNTAIITLESIFSPSFRLNSPSHSFTAMDRIRMTTETI